jgi:hypothetical protein
METGEHVDVAAVSFSEIAVSSRNLFGRLQVDYFAISNGQFALAGGSLDFDYFGPRVSETSIAAVGFLDRASVTAFVDSNGNLEMAVNEGRAAIAAEDRWLSDSGGVSGGSREVEICRLSTTAAEGAYLTGIRTNSGSLKVIHWHVGER